MNPTLHRRPEASLTPSPTAAIFGRTLRSIATVMTIMLLLPISLRAAEPISVIQDDITYLIDPDSHTAVVRTAEKSIASAVIPENVEYEEQFYPVVAIGDSAFEDCASLANLKIGENVITIEDWAFIGCTSLTEVTIPEKVENIGRGIFLECDSLNILYFNATDCEAAQMLTWDAPNVIIGENVTRIPAGLCDTNRNIQSIRIPETVKEIGVGAFNGCEALEQINIPSSINEIKRGTFGGCKSLRQIKLPENLKKIEMDAFYGSGLEKISLPEGLESIGRLGFGYCERLTEIEIPASLRKIDESAFKDCFGLKNVVLDNITDWAQVELYNLSGNPITYAKEFLLKNEDNPITHLNINSLSDVNGGVFSNALNLRTVRVTGSEYIHNFAFYDCSNITDICIETERLGRNTFTVHSAGLNVYSLTSAPPATEETSFLLRDESLTLHDVNLYVPVGSKNLYLSAPVWGEMNIMESEMEDLDRIFDPENFSGVKSIFDYEEAVYFTLDGLRVDADSIAPGTYIRIANGKSTKILVK